MMVHLKVKKKSEDRDVKICRIKSSRPNTISYHVVNIYITYIIIEPEACLVNRGTKMLYKNVVDTQLLAQKKVIYFNTTSSRYSGGDRIA